MELVNALAVLQTLVDAHPFTAHRQAMSRVRLEHYDRKIKNNVVPEDVESLRKMVIDELTAMLEYEPPQPRVNREVNLECTLDNYVNCAMQLRLKLLLERSCELCSRKGLDTFCVECTDCSLFNPQPSVAVGSYVMDAKPEVTGDGTLETSPNNPRPASDVKSFEKDPLGFPSKTRLPEKCKLCVDVTKEAIEQPCLSCMDFDKFRPL